MHTDQSTARHTMQANDTLSHVLRPVNTTVLSRTSSANNLPPRLQATFGRPNRHLAPISMVGRAGGLPAPGPMVPTTRYGPASFRPVIGVRELFLLAPASQIATKPSTADPLFASSVRAMGYWGSHNVYTQPGSFQEGVRKTPLSVRRPHRTLPPFARSSILPPDRMPCVSRSRRRPCRRLRRAAGCSRCRAACPPAASSPSPRRRTESATAPLDACAPLSAC